MLDDLLRLRGGDEDDALLLLGDEMTFDSGVWDTVGEFIIALSSSADEFLEFDNLSDADVIKVFSTLLVIDDSLAIFAFKTVEEKNRWQLWKIKRQLSNYLCL